MHPSHRAVLQNPTPKNLCNLCNLWLKGLNPVALLRVETEVLQDDERVAKPNVNNTADAQNLANRDGNEGRDVTASFPEIWIPIAEFVRRPTLRWKS
jgi:hypothetical protein